MIRATPNWSGCGRGTESTDYRKAADRSGSRSAVIDEIIRLGETYSIVTEYTSFIVLENDAEYARWKIDRKNLLRTTRDRKQQRLVQAGSGRHSGEGNGRSRSRSGRAEVGFQRSRPRQEAAPTAGVVEILKAATWISPPASATPAEVAAAEGEPSTLSPGPLLWRWPGWERRPLEGDEGE